MKKEREKLTSPRHLGSDPPSNIPLTSVTFPFLTLSKIASSNILKLVNLLYKKETQTSINKKSSQTTQQKQPSFTLLLDTHSAYIP